MTSEREQELLNRITELESDLQEAYQRIEWLEEHGPKCKCRECYIYWDDE